MSDSMTSLALHPPRAHGGPVGTAVIRSVPEDFVVDEELGFAPQGEGSHGLLRVRKRGANTDWVARALAREAGVRPMDVGFAGLKDRHAVTTQWFTVPLGKRTAASWLAVAGEGWEVVEAHAHHRKLPRGALDANRFELRLRHWQGDRARLEALLTRIGTEGVPNYFGPQRFGRELSNLKTYRRIAEGRIAEDRSATAAAGPEAGPPRRLRLDEYALSAGRSLLFNAVLARRIEAGTWTTLLAGDIANLDARGSVFPVRGDEADLAARAAQLDVHPTGPLWGRGGSGAEGAIAALEADVAAGFPEVTGVLEAERMAPARRALRIAVRDLTWEFEDDTLRIGFLLRSGGYATAVLRELIDAEAGVSEA
jgi:tRNA pseudouridine13 synthase